MNNLVQDNFYHQKNVNVKFLITYKHMLFFYAFLIANDNSSLQYSSDF
jgi:hypothetical protein